MLMAVSQDGIQVGKCYLAEPGDVVFLVLAIDHDDKVRHEVRTRVAGDASSYSLATMSRERFALSVVREVPSQW
jgi:hypothetical protein